VSKFVYFIPATGLHIGVPCEGLPVGDNPYWDDCCEQRAASGTPQVDPQGNYVFQFEASTCAVGPVGFMVDATKGGAASCTINGPLYSLPGYAAVPPNAKIATIDGIDWCADIGPNGDTVPFTEQPPYQCGDPTETLDIDTAFTVGNSGQHGVLTIRDATRPRGGPTLVVGNPGECTWICFWGSCCGPVGPDCCQDNTPPCP
jgi:hypothetical protein